MAYLKNELSPRSKWHLSKHRYLELKHYCLQYPEWKERLELLTGDLTSHQIAFGGRGSDPADITGQIGSMRAELSNNIEFVERTAREADPDLAGYILCAVTEDRSFPWLSTVMRIPCGKDMYYDRYRKFFWLMSREKG